MVLGPASQLMQAVQNLHFPEIGHKSAANIHPHLLHAAQTSSRPGPQALVHDRG